MAHSGEIGHTEPILLPPEAVLLHVGPHKTGTTAVQSALAAARPRLKAAGVLYPGRGDHNRAAAAALGHAQGWRGNAIERDRWRALAAEARRHHGRVVISSESFCEAEAPSARKVVTDLNRDRVHVAVTLRPLEQLLPSTWQQYVKAGYRMSYLRWLENVLSSREGRPMTPTFWLRNNHAELIRRWADAAGGPGRVTVVIVDPTVPRGLFDTFEDLLGLARNTLEHGSAVTNRSLSLAEVELLRQLNRRVRQRLSNEAYHRLVKRGAVLNIVETRTPPPHEARLTTPDWAIRRAREFGKSDVADIAASGVRVVGDLDALAPDSPVPEVAAPPTLQTVPVGLAATFAAELLVAGLPPDTVGSKLDRAIASARRRFGRAGRRLQVIRG